MQASPCGIREDASMWGHFGKCSMWEASSSSGASLSSFLEEIMHIIGGGGGGVEPGNPNGSWLRDPVAEVYSVISGSVSVWVLVPLVVWCLLFFAKSNEKCFCEIVDDPWWFLDEFCWV